MFLSILTFKFDLNLGSFFYFSEPKWAIFGVGVGFDNCFGVYLCSWINLIFFVSFNYDIWFWLNFGVIFWLLGPQRAIFGVEEGFKNCFGVYSCSWTTFICHVSFNSDIWFWLNFGVIFDVLGPQFIYVIYYTYREKFISFLFYISTSILQF